MSYHNGSARVPAWKRLGLKLKGPASGESPAPASSTNATPASSAPIHQSSPASANSGLKRKQPPHTPVPVSRGPDKRQRTDGVASTPKKTVSFTEDTKTPAEKPAARKTPKKPKEKKTKTKSAGQSAEPFNLEPSLAYLRQWHADRESWKFNKNHQTLLIKACFDAGRIPAADVPVFLAYIQDLKGFVRTRLREEAAEIKKKDMEQGAAGFPQVKEKADKESKQQLYEEVLSKLLHLGQPEGESSTAANGNGKRSFDEIEFAARDMDVDVKQRVIKRMRAELVLQELSDSEESTTSTASGVTTTTTSSSSQGEPAEPAREKRAKLNDGSQQVKRRRLRNSRTADISDDDSSSESESDSDSDSSSSGSSSDDEEDEEMPLPEGQEGAESSSSSSSSSESESEDDSDGESDSEAGARVEQEAGSSSSESDDSEDE